MTGLAFGRAVERSMAHASSILGSLLLFIFTYYFTGRLTFAIIFSTLEMFASVKRSLTFMNIGVGLYFELKVIFGRFAIVFNIEEKAMI